MVFSNADEEIKKYEKIKELCEEINTVEADKLFLTKEQLASLFGCSVRAAGEFMNAPGFPLLKIGGKSLVNIFALNKYTQQRIIVTEVKR